MQDLCHLKTSSGLQFKGKWKKDSGRGHRKNLKGTAGLEANQNGSTAA
jgi:hypothetical protein